MTSLQVSFLLYIRKAISTCLATSHFGLIMKCISDIFHNSFYIFCILAQILLLLTIILLSTIPSVLCPSHNVHWLAVIEFKSESFLLFLKQFLS